MRALALAVLAALAWTSAAFAQPAALPSARPEEVGMSSKRLARIAPVLRQEIEAGRIPGAVVLIVRRGRVVYREAFGAQDPVARTSMRADSLFQIYSMTKCLTAVAAMALVEEGRLVLNEPVSTYLPELANLKLASGAAPARRPTVYDLLRHTAGLSYGEVTADPVLRAAYERAGLYKSGPEYAFNDTALTPEAFVQGIAATPLAYEPGTMWEYSLASDLLGRVVERVEGKRLGEVLDMRLFRPLGMRDSRFFVPQSEAGRLAQVLAKDPITGEPMPLKNPLVRPNNDSGGAGAISTADDYARFAQMLLNGGELGGVRVLSPATVTLMTADHLGESVRRPVEPGELILGVKGYSWGLGFGVRTADGAGVPGSAGEYGWAGYSGTYFWVDPREELVGILMAQIPNNAAMRPRTLIRALTYGAITDRRAR